MRALILLVLFCFNVAFCSADYSLINRFESALLLYYVYFVGHLYQLACLPGQAGRDEGFHYARIFDLTNQYPAAWGLMSVPFSPGGESR